MLCKIEEERFAKLRDMCRELKMPPPVELFYTLKVRDQKGVLVFDDKARGHSWVRNYWHLAAGSLMELSGDGTTASFGAGIRNTKDTAGILTSGAGYCSVRGQGSLQLGYGMHNNTTTNTYGIVVGSGSTAFTVNDFALQTIIASGATAGTLAYQPMIASLASYDAGTKTWTNVISRVFNNNSGGTVNIGEIGIISACGIFESTDTSPRMLERSVLGAAVSILNGVQLTVSYTLSMDFSAID